MKHAMNVVLASTNVPMESMRKARVDPMSLIQMDVSMDVMVVKNCVKPNQLTMLVRPGNHPVAIVTVHVINIKGG